MTDKFWVVWIPNHGTPMQQHIEEGLAVQEAKRLTMKERVPVFVLECVGVAEIKPNPVEYTTIGPPLLYAGPFTAVGGGEEKGQ